jgi:hypothetical protein
MDTPQTTTIKANIPTRMISEIEAMVEAGWAKDVEQVFIDALHHYLDAHRPDLTERFIREDLEWGLHGNE